MIYHSALGGTLAFHGDNYRTLTESNLKEQQTTFKLRLEGGNGTLAYELALLIWYYNLISTLPVDGIFFGIKCAV